MLYISVFPLCIYTRQLERIYFLFHAENSTIKQWTIIASEWERSNYLLLYRTSERRENASHWVSIMSTSTQGSTQQQQHATTTATTITQTTATATISRTMQYTIKSLTRVYAMPLRYRCGSQLRLSHCAYPAFIYLLRGRFRLAISQFPAWEWAWSYNITTIVISSFPHQFTKWYETRLLCRGIRAR